MKPKRFIPWALLFVLLCSCAMPRYTAPAYYPTPGPVARNTSLRDLLYGCAIIAEDGTVLGTIAGKYDSDSIFNQYGQHGSKYATESIWNEYGQYGGKFSTMSPFNPYSQTPPKIVDSSGSVLGYLTVNKFLGGAVSPYALMALFE